MGNYQGLLSGEFGAPEPQPQPQTPNDPMDTLMEDVVDIDLQIGETDEYGQEYEPLDAVKDMIEAILGARGQISQQDFNLMLDQVVIMAMEHGVDRRDVIDLMKEAAKAAGIEISINIFGETENTDEELPDE